MDLSLGTLSYPSVFSEPRYFADHDPHSYLEALIFNGQVDPSAQLPAYFYQNSYTASASSDSRFQQQQVHDPFTQSMFNPHHQLDDADAQGIPMVIEGILRDKTVAEERAKKRREQNRASQRSYRQRKDKYIEQLERQNKDFQEQNLALLDENEQLRLELSQFKSRVLTNDSAIHPSLSPPSSPANSLPQSSPATADWYGGRHLDAEFFSRRLDGLEALG